jgi:unsaturated rhamnogalacturonyl hydrolase
MAGYLRKQLFVLLVLLFIVTNLSVSFASAGQSLITYKAGQSPADVGRRLVRNLLSRNGYMLYGNYGLHYAEACTAYSAYRFAGLTGDKKLLAELNNRYGSIADSNELISDRRHVDQSVVGILPLEIFMQTSDKKFLRLGLSIADRQWQNPQADGLTSETRWWIDDTYMVGMLQMQAYRATGEIKYADRAALEVAAYLEKLQQPSGLFFHGPENHFYWGRGNGWVAAALTEILKSLPQDHPRRKEIMAGYLRMMTALLKYQADNGMWRQLIDYPQAWTESSCTAMFTYAMITGTKNGWLEEKEFRAAVQKAWDALCSHLDGNANLTDICAGTGRGDNIEFYLKRPRLVGDLHGQAPLLWCVCELLDPAPPAQAARTPCQQTDTNSDKGGKSMEIKITSSVFDEGGMIPPKYTCDGDDISPPLKWDSVPQGTKSIALISDDPDAPRGTWVHWVLYNLPPDKRELPEALATDEKLPDGSRQGVTDFGRTGYGGPCPPSGTHRYYFKMYALDTVIQSDTLLNKNSLLQQMEGHILAQGQLMGRYKRR